MEFSFSDRPWVIHDRLSSLKLQKMSCISHQDLGFLRTQKTRPSSPGKEGNGFAKGTVGNPPGKLALGLHVPGTFNKVIDVDACLLQEDRGNEILRAVKKFAKNPAFHHTISRPTRDSGAS
jgi:hypothetical protein